MALNILYYEKVKDRGWVKINFNFVEFSLEQVEQLKQNTLVKFYIILSFIFKKDSCWNTD